MTDTRAAALEKLNAAYFSAEPHEANTVANLHKLVRRGLAVDAGASLGQYTKALLALMHDGTVVAVEADPWRAAELTRNVAGWSAAAKATGRVVNAALTDQDGDTTFHVTDSDVSGGLTVSDAIERRGYREISVSGVRLDGLVDEVPAFVKIDVEGAEAQVLRGAPRIVAARKTVFLVELHTPESGREVRSILDASGYRMAPFYGQTVFTPHFGQWLRLMAMGWPQAFAGRILGKARAVFSMASRR